MESEKIVFTHIFMADLELIKSKCWAVLIRHNPQDRYLALVLPAV